MIVIVSILCSTEGHTTLEVSSGNFKKQNSMKAVLAAAHELTSFFPQNNLLILYVFNRKNPLKQLSEI